ncbi:hypothetical protein LTR17_025771 [Elasticomyces elasticus]|nr:hypothetical protein LTR17_025771 [Elasticomyces elasticus]
MSISERLDRLEARLDRHERYLDYFDKSLVNPAIRIGVARLRYDFIRRMRNEVEAAGVRGSKTRGGESDSEVEGLDEYVRLITEEMLQEVGLGQLVGCLGFFKGMRVGGDCSYDAGVSGNESEVAAFAYAVVEGEKLGDARCAKIKRESGKAFQYTYGMSFEEAAAEVNDEEPNMLPTA